VGWTGVIKADGQPSEFQNWYIGEFRRKTIQVVKFDDSWFLIEEMWYNSWNKYPHYYLCDELESIKYIDFYG
jgi:hypothetical protein